MVIIKWWVHLESILFGFEVLRFFADSSFIEIGVQKLHGSTECFATFFETLLFSIIEIFEIFFTVSQTYLVLILNYLKLLHQFAHNLFWTIGFVVAFYSQFSRNNHNTDQAMNCGSYSIEFFYAIQPARTSYVVSYTSHLRHLSLGHKILYTDSFFGIYIVNKLSIGDN